MSALTFLRQYAEVHGDEKLVNRPALALAVRMAPTYSVDDRRAAFEPSMLVYPVMDPVLAAQMELAGARARGTMTWQVGLPDDNPSFRALNALLDSAWPGIVLPAGAISTSRGPAELEELRYWLLRWESGGYRAAQRILAHYKDRIRNSNPYAESATGGRGTATQGVISVKISNRSLWIQGFTYRLTLPDSLIEEIGPVNLNLRVPGRARRNPVPLRPAEAAAVCEWAVAGGMELVDADGSQALSKMRNRLANHVIAWSRPGRPAQAVLSVGARVTFPGVGKLVQRRGGVAVNGPAGKISRASKVTFGDVEGLARIRDAGVPVIAHPAVADVVALAEAVPVDDPYLRPFQREAVGRHESTAVGYVNLCSPGAGKTIMSLRGMRSRATQIRGWRGLVIAEANVRAQFAEEAERWFPEAHVVRVQSSSDKELLGEVLSAAGDLPVLVVTSYTLAGRVSRLVASTGDVRTSIAELFAADAAADNEAAAGNEAPERGAGTRRGRRHARRQQGADAKTTADSASGDAADSLSLEQLLLDTHWHDLVADEAACLRNTASRQSKAMWALRERADVAVALTGTPMSRSLDDLGHIIAWARNDRHLFNGTKLSELFDLSDEAGRHEFSAAMGPVVLRYDKSEFSDELPPMDPPLILELEPSPAELRLARAAQEELRRVYDELCVCVEEAGRTDPGNPEYDEVRKALVSARGAWLGGTQLARMAASDPASLLESNSAGAALLYAHGLVQAANEQAGTKRAAIVERCVQWISEGERILLFTEFSTVARGLISDLREAGLRVGEILGGGGARRDVYIAEFARGELDIMVATSAGERGLNLQTATMLVNYDLPWTAGSLLQRCGRVERIGSTAERLKLVFPIMKGTIEERVVAMVASRAAAMMQALDGVRGIDLRESEFARALGGLVSVADSTRLGSRDAELLDVTRELLAA